jgi:hypothetical protein
MDALDIYQKYTWRLNYAHASSYVWKACLLPYEGNKCVLVQLRAVKCGFCLEVIKLNENLSTSNPKVHFETVHKGTVIPGQSST